jgi:hypothetical protein
MKSKALVISGVIIIAISGVFLITMSSIPVLVHSDLINEKSNIEAGPVSLTNIPQGAVIILFIFSVIFLSGLGLLVKGFG